MSEVERAILYFFVGFLVMWFLLKDNGNIEEEVKNEIEEMKVGVREDVYMLVLLNRKRKIRLEEGVFVNNRFVVKGRDGIIYEVLNGVKVDDVLIVEDNELNYVDENHIIINGLDLSSVKHEIAQSKVHMKKYDILIKHMKKIARIEDSEKEAKKVEL